MKMLTAYLSLVLSLLASCMAAAAADNAVILLYHHVSHETPASTSVTPETFQQHLEYLSAGHTVIPLEQAVNALKNGETLPDYAVAITFDDGFRNIYENAHPLLLKYKMPYTVFINPQEIGASPLQLTWEQIAEMERNGARFANHTSNHDHLLEWTGGESESQWLARVKDDILQAEALLREKLGYGLGYLAYPYGEFNGAIQRLVAANGMVGFGQHSGAISSGSDFTALPRFPAAGIYANLKSLEVKINSLAFPVNYAAPEEIPANFPVLPAPDALEDFSFSYRGTDLTASALACYLGTDSLPVAVEQNTVHVTVNKPLPIGRSRINCTAPSRSERGRYYWYSQPWFIPLADGSYPE